MLSIVKMDLDSDSESMEAFSKEEVLDIKDEPFEHFEDLDNEDDMIFNGLELVPVVYTTRLDDMTILKSDLSKLYPQEVTAKILKESKPILRMYPSNDLSHSSLKTFRSVKAKLEKLYTEPERINLKPIPPLQFGSNCIKREASEELNTTCQYSELLKLCRPFSIVLSKEIEYQGSKSIVIHGDRVLETNKVAEKEPRKILPTYHDEDDEPLITLKPENFSLDDSLKENESSKQANNLKPTFLIRIKDLYSKEYSIYCTDEKAHIIDYYNDMHVNIHKYGNITKYKNYKVSSYENCCWVKRNELVNSFYPRLVTQTSDLRFVRKPHTCPPGACSCCCRKEEHYKPPDFSITGDNTLNSTPRAVDEDLEIQVLEDEIQNSLINMNKSPKFNNTNLLRNLITSNKVSKTSKAFSLIDRALIYEKPSKKQSYDSRRLMSSGCESSYPRLLIFSKHESEDKEIYDITKHGEIQCYVKINLAEYKGQPNIQAMLQKPKSSYNICCWYRREKVITHLLDLKFLHPSAVKFMRTCHRCIGDACNCCCKGKDDKLPILSDTKLTWPKIPESDTGTEQYQSGTEEIISKKLGESFANLPTRKSDNTGSDPDKSKKTSFIPAPIDNPYVKLYPDSVPTKNTTPTEDDDCEIVSVNQSSLCSSKPDPLATEVKFTPNVEDNEGLSEEVNTLISSILDRFKDVRLTINSDGKVAAALNTPVSTLTTVELKVLANILSYAQGQINSLGITSNMSLSSVINLKMGDVQSTAGNESAGIYKEFGNNVKFNKKSQECIIVQPSEINKSASNTDLTNNVVKDNAYHDFSESLHKTNSGFNDSFASFLLTKYETEEFKNPVTPIIQNVFSLKDHEIPEMENDNTFATLVSTAHAQQQSSVNKNTLKKNNISVKRAQEEPKTSASKRIRVVSPSKLGAPSTDAPNNMNKFFKSTPVLNSQNLTDTQRVPLLSNKSLRLISVANSKAKQNVRTTGLACASNVNFTKPIRPMSNPLLEVSPLITPKASTSKEGTGPPVKEVSSSISVVSVATPSAAVQPENVTSNNDNDDDADCILGM